MKVLAELWQLIASLDQSLGKVAGMRGGKSNSLNAFHTGDEIQEVRECPKASTRAVDSHTRQVSAVRIDILTQESYLFISCTLQVHSHSVTGGGANQKQNDIYKYKGIAPERPSASRSFLIA